MTKRGRDVRRNPDVEVHLQIDKGGVLLLRRIQKSLFALTKNNNNKVLEFSFTPAHRGFFCCRPLCIAPVQLQCKVIGDWPLHAAGGIGTCTTHTCSERLLVGEKAKPLIFARKKESCFPKVEHT